jgi:hypothetical protein
MDPDDHSDIHRDIHERVKAGVKAVLEQLNISRPSTDRRASIGVGNATATTAEGSSRRWARLSSSRCPETVKGSFSPRCSNATNA